MDFVDDWSVGGEVLVAGLDLGVPLEVALGPQVVGDLGGRVQSKSQSNPFNSRDVHNFATSYCNTILLSVAACSSLSHKSVLGRRGSVHSHSSLNLVMTYVLQTKVKAQNYLSEVA